MGKQLFTTDHIIVKETVNDNGYVSKTIAELSDEWIAIRSAQVKESTLANYKMKLEKHIIPFLGELYPEQIDPRCLSEFVEKEHSSGLCSKYIADLIVVLKCVLRYSKAQYGTQDHIEGFAMPQRHNNSMRLLTEQQQRMLIEFITHDMSLCSTGAALSLFMGLRIGEICALRWQDVDFVARIIRISKTIQRISTACDEGASKRTKIIMTEPKSFSSNREIPLSQNMYEYLIRRRGDPQNYITSASLKPVEPRTMQYRFSKLLERMDLPKVNFHTLRHMFATNCIAMGFDVKTLSEILGHSSVEITLNRYVHSSFERKRKCMELISW